MSLSPLAKSRLRHVGAVVEHDHVEPVGPARQPRPPWRFASTPADATDTVPQLGEHTRAVLTGRLGLSDADVDRLHADGVVNWRTKG